MRRIENILVMQTAFLGDVILTLPLIQITKQYFHPARIDVLTTPRTARILDNHPDISTVLEFDKRGRDAGMRGLLHVAAKVRSRRYDVALVPHRSLRSALLLLFAGIPMTIGFKKGAGRLLFTRSIRYQDDLHEIERNLSLLGGFGISWDQKEYPHIYPSTQDANVVDRLLLESEILETGCMVAVAPGTVWNTKRWLKERYAEVVQRFVEDHYVVALIGGSEDRELCEEIVRSVMPRGRVLNTAGKLSLLQSAELLRRCQLLVCNDSAPMHMAVAVQTPVVAVFGATIPEFGFAPYGKHDVVVEIRGLNCRPCSNHGGAKCPIKTFVCMKEITAQRVYQRAMGVLEQTEMRR